MNIFFNFELYETDNERKEANPALYNLLQTDQNVRVYFEELRGFIRQRMNVLEDEIEAEEAKNDCMIMFNFPDKSIPELRPYYLGYSEGLIDKLNTSFTVDDFNYLSAELMRRYPGLNNV